MELGVREDDRKQDEEQMFAELRLVAPRADRQETHGGKLAHASLSPGDVRKEPPRFVARLRFCCFCANTNFLMLSAFQRKHV